MRRFAAFTLGLTFVIFASCPVCLPNVAVAADALDVRDLVTKYASQRKRLHSLKATARLTLLHDSSGAVAPESSKWSVEYDFWDTSTQTHVVTHIPEGAPSGENLELYADFKRGELYEKRGGPAGGESGLVVSASRFGGKLCLQRDLEPWLLLGFTPAINEDPRLTIEELLKYSPTVPEATTLSDGKVCIEVGWPLDASIPSSTHTLGTLRITLDPAKNYTVVQVEKRYRSITDDEPDDSDVPLKWMQRLTARKFVHDDRSGVYLPVEVDAESFSLGLDGTTTLVYRELITVNDYDINPSLGDRLGFRYGDGTVVHALGTLDGAVAEKFMVYGTDGTMPAATFNDQGDAIDYVIEAKCEALRKPIVIDRGRLLLFWIVAGCVTLLVLIYFLIHNFRARS